MADDKTSKLRYFLEYFIDHLEEHLNELLEYSEAIRDEELINAIREAAECIRMGENKLKQILNKLTS